MIINNFPIKFSVHLSISIDPLEEDHPCGGACRRMDGKFPAECSHPFMPFGLLRGAFDELSTNGWKLFLTKSLVQAEAGLPEKTCQVFKTWQVWDIRRRGVFDLPSKRVQACSNTPT
jgi:hypothetical protein